MRVLPPCVRCGTTGGARWKDWRTGRPRLRADGTAYGVPGLVCCGCFQAIRTCANRRGAPCARCGTTGGVMRADRPRPIRLQGMCRRCYRQTQADIATSYRRAYAGALVARRPPPPPPAHSPAERVEIEIEPVELEERIARVRAVKDRKWVPGRRSPILTESELNACFANEVTP